MLEFLHDGSLSGTAAVQCITPASKCQAGRGNRMGNAVAIYELRFTIYDFREFARYARSSGAGAGQNFGDEGVVIGGKRRGNRMGNAVAIYELRFTIYELRFIDNVRVAQIFGLSTYAEGVFKVVIMPPSRQESTWREQRSHASFASLIPFHPDPTWSACPGSSCVCTRRAYRRVAGVCDLYDFQSNRSAYCANNGSGWWEILRSSN